MNYYEVYVSEIRYQKSDALVYSSSEKINVGTIVKVAYGNKSVYGFISSETEEPSFKTKPIEEVIEIENIPEELIELHKWIKTFYPSGSGAITQLILPSNLKLLKKGTEASTKLKKIINSPTLTIEQSQTLENIEKSKKKSFLIHGETGSGKTRIYLELTRKVIESGKSAIILSPEISLINQLSKSFESSFNNEVIVMHSGLTRSKKNSNWIKALNAKQPIIVIGTRSAIFTPVYKLGLVVVDEMHEPAYKQDSAPRYNALRIAAKRSQINNAITVYGSATPSIADYYLASEIGIPILEMPSKAKISAKVKTDIIDIKERSNFSRNPYVSNQILAEIENRIIKKEQSLLFLNRRGTAKQIVCQDCGWQALCPRCDLPLTLHADSHKVRCHTCGFSDKPPYSCPVCGSSDIKYKSLGTKALVETMENLFPGTNIRRFDTDNLASEKISKNFDSVYSGEVDILIGTQMLGKGLDLPKLSLVGVINADMALSMPDFSSTERNYQLIHQAIGRVGRGHIDGQVIAQSFNPEDRLLNAALDQDWKYLYKKELEEREKYNFPPFCYLLKIVVSRKTSDSAEKFIYGLRQKITTFGIRVSISEPAPSFYEKSYGKYNWQIVIKSSQRKNLVDIVNLLPVGDFNYDIDPLHLL